MAPLQAAAIDSLPPELLLCIFDFLDGAPPSSTYKRLRGQPSDGMLQNPYCPLKTLSLVSTRWRAILRPLLFRAVLWTLTQSAFDSIWTSGPVGRIPVLDFLLAHDLGRHVRSLTIMVCKRAAAEAPAESTSSVQRARQSLRMLMGFVGLSYNDDQNTWFWDMMFRVINPLRVTIIASPRTLSQVLSCRFLVGTSGPHSAGDALHILSLSRRSRVESTSQRPSESSPGAPSSGFPPPSDSSWDWRNPIRNTLMSIKPWTHLLLNENSSIRVYANRHYLDPHPPSILASLLGFGSPGDGGMIPPTVTSLTYVAIFPAVAHFRQLVDHLPRIDHLRVQLAPLDDAQFEMGEIDFNTATSLWVGFHACYEPIFRNLLRHGHKPRGNPPLEPLSPNWRRLHRFEAVDCDAQNDSPQLVQLCHAGWHSWRTGVFVKKPCMCPPRPAFRGVISPFHYSTSGRLDPFRWGVEPFLAFLCPDRVNDMFHALAPSVAGVDGYMLLLGIYLYLNFSI
ncbi:hypothetical protein N658DRAFT_492537 [Parathielavia hyrcaniae]|uniref:F-box domain-containing protein n=1 Tax=Parathielavia hyrcaniae TaxID=113614 RepID=A0AAN6Q7Q1_9PEZI|nr:hypothetical protein N658DRAFT_492537 [Parathielavia hyrcaniae]